MKVLHVIPGVAARYGGPSQAVYNMCQSLQHSGCETLICTTDADGESELPVELGSIKSYQGVPTIFFSRQLTEAYKYSRPLASWLENSVGNFDVVHIHAVFSHSSLAAYKACRKNNVPYVIRPLGSLSASSLNQKRLRKSIFWRLGVKQMLHNASAIHYTTAEEKRLAESHLSLKNGVVVPLGIDEDVLDLYPTREPSSGRPGADRPYVLVLSRLHPIKGLELFLEAFTKLIRRHEFSKWQLIIAGDGEPKYVGSLKNIVAQAKACEHVLFPGWVDGADKLALLKNASLLALPSRHENFGLCIVESLACGVPVLVSPHVNLAEEIKAAGAGWVVPLENRELENALAESLRDERERTHRGAAGKEFVSRRFAWGMVAEELNRLYASIAVKRKKDS